VGAGLIFGYLTRILHLCELETAPQTTVKPIIYSFSQYEINEDVNGKNNI